MYVCIGNDRPSHKLLNKYVTNQVASHWQKLGVQLLDEESVYKLKNIEKNYPNDVEKCCSEMLEYWIETDPEASWDTLIDALDQCGQNVLAAKIKMDILEGIFT